MYTVYISTNEIQFTVMVISSASSRRLRWRPPETGARLQVECHHPWLHFLRRKYKSHAPIRNCQGGKPRLLFVIVLIVCPFITDQVNERDNIKNWACAMSHALDGFSCRVPCKMHDFRPDARQNYC